MIVSEFHSDPFNKRCLNCPLYIGKAVTPTIVTAFLT